MPWMVMWIALGFVALVTAFAGGCARTVLVSEASPIRIGEGARARVYTLQGGEWVLSQNCVTIPEGWYAVPPSFVEEDDARDDPRH